MVFNTVLPIFTQLIKSETVLCRIIKSEQLISKESPLSWVNLTFKNRILNPHAIIQTDFSDAPQTCRATRILHRDVIGYKYHHFKLLPEYAWRISLQIAS